MEKLCIDMSEAALMIFVKNPELGKAKTRLAKTIGNEAALQIYELLLDKTHEVVQPLEIDLQVHYTSFIDQNDLWENEKFSKQLQLQADLGEKMRSAFENSFASGFKKVCIIGSDCYDLTTAILESAFEQLSNHDFVIGPSKDGGYYLLGMTEFQPSLFQDISWSTSTVFSETIKKITSLNKNYSELPLLSDVDVEADLGDWANKIMGS